MERKKYCCSGCGKVVIGDDLPAGWRMARGIPRRCLCEQCRDELRPLHLLVPA